MLQQQFKRESIFFISNIFTRGAILNEIARATQKLYELIVKTKSKHKQICYIAFITNEKKNTQNITF